MIPDSPTCEDCPFWDSVMDKKKTRKGFCLRYPPTVVLIPDGSEFTSGWPQTSEHEWCGEHPRFMEWHKAIQAEMDEAMRDDVPSKPLHRRQPNDP